MQYAYLFISLSPFMGENIIFENCKKETVC